MKKKVQVLLIGLAVMAVAGCGGPTKEKIEEVQSVYAELVNRHNEVVEEYADFEDTSLSIELDKMAEKINNMGQQDTKDMTDAELDGIIADLREDIAVYDDILTSIEKIKEEEEKEEMHAIPVTIKNNTGVKLFQLYLYKAAEKDKGDNLAEDIGYLDGYQTLNILNLYMMEDEMLWNLEAKDEEGNIIESAEVDFAGYNENGVTVSMEYSFDSMEGWLELEEICMK